MPTGVVVSRGSPARLRPASARWSAGTALTAARQAVSPFQAARNEGRPRASVAIWRR